MAFVSTDGNTKTKIPYYFSDGVLSTQSSGDDKKNDALKKMAAETLLGLSVRVFRVF